MKPSANEEKIVKGKKVSFLKFKRSDLCIPYGLFLVLFVICPLLMILYYAFTSQTGGFSFENVVWFFSSKDSLKVLYESIILGFTTMLICLILAYPVAYILSRIKTHRKTILLLLFIMPMWINFVIRAMAMKELLDILGLYGNNNYLCTIIGMVYDYLPFMVLPLYTTLIKMDKSLEEAALDLGANKAKVFIKITLPLSMPGIISGITMVFLPSMTCYVISDTYGSGKIMIIGKLIENWFGSGSNWNYGSIIALVLLVIMFLSSLFTGKFSNNEDMRGTNL